MIKPTQIFTFSAVFLLCHFVCPSLMVAQTSNAKAAEPLNVLDYYLLMSPKELSLLEDSKKTRKELIQVQDVANGYLVLGDKDFQGITQVALFRKKNREALIGVADTEQTVASTGSVKFLQYSGDKWSDVTADVLPKVADKEILAAYNRIKKGEDEARTLQQMPSVYWQLPKKGTTVELRCGEDSDSKDKALMKFAWDGTHFAKQSK